MNVTNTPIAPTSSSGPLPTGLAPGSELISVTFTAEPTAGQQVLLELPAAFQTFAVVGKREAAEQAASAGSSAVQFELLTVPSANHQATELQNMATIWVDAASSNRSAPTQMMTLQGAQIFWNSARVAILAPAERLATVRSAVIEAFWYDAELSDLERVLSEVWPNLQRDTPLAFSFDAKSLPRIPELKQRFQKIMAIRARQARLAPHAHCPHLHPPTLASQVGERFRERTRLLHRHEILGEQLEVFEKVYDSCGQRSSDFVQSRTGHTLEWIIIVLLLTQILLWGFEILTNLAPTTVVQ